MNDQTIPTGLTPEDAKKAREWALHALNKPGASTMAEKAVARVVLAALPAPPRPTLADMTPKERAACQWMQADVEGQEPSAVITYPDRGRELVKLIDRWGKIIYADSDLVTPRPDLPRMTWPDTVPESTLAVGSVWDDGDSLTRACEETGRDQITVTDCEGDVYVWDANQYDWRDLHPIPNYAPFTIIYAGKKADQ